MLVHHVRRRAATSLAVVAAVLAALLGAAPSAVAAPGDGYWSTDGSGLVDAGGAEVEIRGVNWFGFETSVGAPHGLWTRNMEEVLDQVADLGFNTIRVPFSSAMLDGSSPTGINLAENPDLEGLTSLEVLDRFIDYSGQLGLKIILDRHTLDPDNRYKLWYNDAFPAERLVTDWELLAERYAGNETVIGADLYNEPHDEACWGCDDPARDWKAAAEKAGNAIQAINPGWLIIVEGVEKADGGACPPGDASGCTWWGGNLLNAGTDPVELDVPDQVVYSPHEYATSVFEQPWFNDPEFPENLEPIWDRFWGYLAKDDIAPIMVGEFGTTLEDPRDAVWLEQLLAYMDRIGAGFTFWTLNPNSGDTGGILNDDWTTVDNEKYGYLESYLTGTFEPTSGDPGPGDPGPGDPEPGDPGPSDPGPSDPGPSDPEPGDPGPSDPGPSDPEPGDPGPGDPAVACRATVEVSDQWNSGYVATVTLTNTGTEAIDGWTFGWRFNDGETVDNAWNADVSLDGAEATAESLSFNTVIAPGGSTSFGFVAGYDGSSLDAPTGFTLNGTPCGS